MKPPAEEVDARLWAIVTSTVRPLRPRRPALPQATAVAPPAAEPVAAAEGGARSRKPAAGVEPPSSRNTAAAPTPRRPVPLPTPHRIEPGRQRRLERGRDPILGVIDLHGLDQDRARAALTGFVQRSVAEHHRAILVITGKGRLGDGVLRRCVPDWLGEPPLRALVAGVSEAHRRHGGEGALYVALKRPASLRA
jgi:DNA-nicking Smr family endonuclease